MTADGADVCHEMLKFLCSISMYFALQQQHHLFVLQTGFRMDLQVGFATTTTLEYIHGMKLRFVNVSCLDQEIIHRLKYVMLHHTFVGLNFSFALKLFSLK